MKKTLILGLVLLVASCVGTSPASQFFTLRATGADENVISEKITASIGVEPVKIPYLLDRPQIVVLKENEIEVSISERHRWAEPLAVIIQRTLVEDLSAELPKAKIISKNYPLEKFDRSVVVDISKFDATLGDKVVLEAWYRLTNAVGKQTAQKKFTLTKKVGGTYEDLVAVQSQMVRELALAIAQTIAKGK